MLHVPGRACGSSSQATSWKLGRPATGPMQARATSRMTESTPVATSGRGGRVEHWRGGRDGGKGAAMPRARLRPCRAFHKRKGESRHLSRVCNKSNQP
eukprot:scaffold31071_cov101-Isochrysis_galbana.AAC.1